MVNASLLEKLNRLKVPASTTIELLSPCNLDCVHCYVTQSKKSVLSLEVLDDLFAQLADLGGLRVKLTGGEIALRKDLFQIIAAARQRHFMVDLLTSGTLWGPREWDRVAELAVEEVRLSLYAVEPCVHDEVTTEAGSHGRTLATIDGLRARGVRVAVSCPVLSVNAEQVGAVLAFARERDMEFMVEAELMDMDVGGQRPKSYSASIEQMAAIYRDPRYGRPHADYEECAAPEDSDRPCATGERSCFIRSTGEVLPCAKWPDAAGNIIDTPFKEIWLDGPAFHQARGFTNADFKTCHSCGDRPGCRPCAGMNLKERGAIANPAPGVCANGAARAIAAVGRSLQPTPKPGDAHSLSVGRLPILPASGPHQ